jgi:quercetin dioxygenase-like cupin family protein
MNCTELLELAAAHALGALPTTDAARFEAALANDRAARVELAAFQDAVAAVAAAGVVPVQPPAGLRAKILDRAARTPQARPSGAAPATAGGFRFVLNDDPGWVSGRVPGLKIKPLSVSRDMGYQVLLAELAPGASFPEHDHTNSEELFIVSGHLQTEGRLMGPGDFLHAEPGTHHHELVSPDGCVALLINRAPVPAPA